MAFRKSADINLSCQLSYQVVHLMVPSTRNEDYFPCFLDDFKRGTALGIAWVKAAVLKIRHSDVKGQVTMAISKVLLLPRGIEQPFLFPADIGRPAVGAEDVGMKRSPVDQVKG